MVEPIKPKEVVGKKKEALPDEVIEAFNELIAEHWKNKSSSFLQRKVIARIQQKMGAGVISGQEICDKGYLDVEAIYIKAGWDVKYNSPAYNESYSESFDFSEKRRK